jgi:4'-phosphopantetheinyl transferase
MSDLCITEHNAGIGSRLASVAGLAEGHVHIWRLEPEPEVELSRYFRLLDSDEQDRARRFRFPNLTRNFIVDHGRLRLLLGAYTQSRPEDLVFARNEFGKPKLANPALTNHRLHFNLSHTKGLTLLAVCLGSEVGIDVEAVRPMDDWQGIALSHFSPRENAALQSTIESDRQNGFFRCWTRKEAFLKANGLGLSKPLDLFAVSLAADEFPELLSCEWDSQATSRWSLVSLALGPEFAAALAIQRREWTLRFFNWAGNL